MNEPIEPQFHRLMNTLADVLDQTFNGDDKSVPPKVGFTLLTFNFGDNSRVNYISNAKREDMLATMKAFIARSEGRMPDSQSKDTH